MNIIDLNGNWTCINQDDTTQSFPAIVPGCIHTDLLRQNIIPNLNYRDNELKAHWVSEKTWCYHKTFICSNFFLENEKILLHCEGLDTLAKIKINQQTVALTNNMFRTWDFDVKSFLKIGENQIEIYFSPLFETMEQKQRDEKILPTWNIYDSRAAGRSWIRKMPCNFGWDWGLVAITCGIWKPISLIGFSEALINDLHITQIHQKETVSLIFNWQLSITEKTTFPFDAEIEILTPSGEVITQNLTISSTSGQCSVLVEQPQLWWPSQMGKQPLYHITFRLIKNKIIFDEKKQRLGLRTIRLRRQEDNWGESFEFIINNQPFFAKGANWIPANIFVSSLTRKNYLTWINNAVSGNMNMLRVWGGGIYESDDFYDLCDELGILVWQEFIFACSSYPSFNKDFMDNVKEEAIDNIRRIRHHASLAFWCGNNEIEQGIVDEEWNEFSMSWQDYGKLFEQLLPSLVKQYDSEHDYWIGSPHTPHGNRQDFNNPTCGDAHCWDVWFGGQNFEYQRSWNHRFMSEFGFQSFPSPRTIDAFTLPEDRNLTSYVVDYHQRSPNGNRKIFAYLLDWFRFPKNFEETLWLTQLTQAIAIQYACEHGRRIQPRMMGTLYWQFNDLWPCASWSSVDSFGRWKALQYFTKRFYAPIMLSIVEDNNKQSMTIHISNHNLKEITGLCTWQATSLDGTSYLSNSLSITIPAQTNNKVVEVFCDEIIKDKIKTATNLFNPPNKAEQQFIFTAKIEVEGKCVSQNIQFFTKPKYLELISPNIRSKIYKEQGIIKLLLIAEYPALFVRLELINIDVIFSDNFFFLNRNEPYEISIESASEKLTIQKVQETLQIHSLVDSY